MLRYFVVCSCCFKVVWIVFANLQLPACRLPAGKTGQKQGWQFLQAKVPKALAEYFRYSWVVLFV